MSKPTADENLLKILDAMTEFELYLNQSQRPASKDYGYYAALAKLEGVMGDVFGNQWLADGIVRRAGK